MAADIPSAFFRISEEILNSIKGISYTVLIGEGDEIKEGWIRTGVGRSYYAAFLVARRTLELEYLTTSEVHKRVVELLKEIDSQSANMLMTLRDLRNQADYDIGKEFNEKELEYSVVLSKNIIKRIISDSDLH